MPLPGTVSPLTGHELSPVRASTPLDIRSVVARARAAQPAFGALTLAQRAEACRQFARRVLLARDELAELMVAETGRSSAECLLADGVVIVADYAKAAIRVAEQALAPEPIRLSPLDWPGKKVVVEAVPRGVVAIIAPWNYPFGNFLKSIFPALLAGNAIVLKPSEHTPRTGAWLVRQLEAVLPPGVVGLVQGAGDAGTQLIEAGVDAVVFTGSVRSGRRVAGMAAERLIPCSLELGGKDAAIVLADCDLPRTIAGVAMWSFHNGGQNCAAIERVYVEDAIADPFVDGLSRYAASLVGPSGREVYDVGPVQNEAQLKIIEAHVEDARARGAVVRCGGERAEPGLCFRPTVLDRCTKEMRVVAEETFGPVVAVVRVKDAEEAIRQANDSPFGLNGSIWTRDLERGAAMARRLEVGVAHVNNHAFTGALAETPWTGTKDTGPGVAASRHAYALFARRRTLVIDSSKKPDPIWYPIDEVSRALAAAVAERGLGKLSSLLKLPGLVSRRLRAIDALTKRALS